MGGVVWWLRQARLITAGIVLTWVAAAGSIVAEADQKDKFSVKLTGHYANVFSGSRTTQDKPFTSDFQRLRVELHPRYGDALSGLLAYDQRLLVSNLIRTPDFSIAQNRQRRQWMDLDAQFVQKGNVRWDHLVYRGYLTYRHEPLDVQIGRQQIPWGLGYFWTPTDLFNPFDPLAIEKEERIGTDALDCKIHWRNRQYLEFVYAPQQKRRQDTAAGKFHFAFGPREFSFILAEAKENEVVGVDYLQNLWQAAVRTELTWTNAQHEADFWKFVVNMDYTFPSSLYVLGEYHFNGQGRRDKNAYQRVRRTLGEIDFLAQDFCGVSLGYDLTPLLRAENHLIWVLDDQSFFVNPELRWGVTKNSELLVGGQVFFGRQGTEYGEEHNVGYIRWKLFF